MKHMTKGERVKKKEAVFEDVRRKLAEMRRELIRESRSELGYALQEGDKYSGVFDDGDLADIALRDSLHDAKLNRHQARLKAIEEALRRIDEGIYGICEECGSEIPIGRLKAMPFAVRCVDCQERRELMGPEIEEPISGSPDSEEGENED